MSLLPELIRPDLQSPEAMMGAGSRQFQVEETHLACLHRETGWLRFDVRLPEQRASDLERLLALNQALFGGAKFCLSPLGEPYLRLDMALRSEEDDGEDRIPLALACLQQALQALLRDEDPISPAPPVDPLPADLPAVKSVCAAAGWPCLERAPGHWMVELEGTPAFCQAEITLQEGGLCLCVVLAEWEELPIPCAEAVTHLLLTAGDIFRMACPAIDTQGPKRRALLLARLPFADLETNLLHALSALSVGAARLQREVGALQNPEIAGIYLAMTSSTLEEKRRNNHE